MTNINELKFTIEPEETIEMEQFVNSDNKEKEKTRRLEENKSNRINSPNFLGREVSNRLKFIGS